MIIGKRIKELKSELKYKRHNNDFVIIDDERAIINVGAENYDDIFSPHCYKGGDTLSSSLVDYLGQKNNAVHYDYDLTIRFHVKNATEEKRVEIENAIKENYVNEVRGIEEKMHRTTIFSMWFVILGVLFSAIYLLLIHFASTEFTYLIDIFAWLFLWEGTDAFFLDRRMMQLNLVRAYRLATAKIEIIEFEPY